MNWDNNMGEYGDIAVSTRVRLARNLREYPFPGRMSEQQEKELLDSVSSFLTGIAGGTSFRFVNVSDKDPITVGSMVEHHLISPELAIKHGSRGVVLSDDDSICIMINEEDHLRIQTILSGLKLKDCMATVDKLDDLLDGNFHYAWSDQFGYLTHCPTNLGTGCAPASCFIFRRIRKQARFARWSQTSASLVSLSGGFTEKVQRQPDRFIRYPISLRSAYPKPIPSTGWTK
jgi:protein-arginine kinase